eukprot:7840094-Pyramimonas_sp.AAC.1
MLRLFTKTSRGSHGHVLLTSNGIISCEEEAYASHQGQVDCKVSPSPPRGCRGLRPESAIHSVTQSSQVGVIIRV